MARKRTSAPTPTPPPAPPSVEAGSATVATEYGPRPLSTAQALALAVLRGDTSAIGPLVDHLSETRQYSPRELPPVRQITVDRDRLRAIFYVSPDAELADVTRMQVAFYNWLVYQDPLILTGIDRVELFELPEWATGRGADYTGTGTT